MIIIAFAIGYIDDVTGPQPHHYENQIVIVDKKYLRAEELKYLKGDSTKLRETLGWKPEYTFEMLMDEMIEHWMNIDV